MSNIIARSFRRIVPQTVAGGARTNPVPPAGYRPAVESLENRCFLSVSNDVVATAPPQVQAPLPTPPVASAYAGALKFTDPARRPLSDVIVDVTTKNAAGELAGRLTSAAVGDVEFSGEMQGRKFALVYDLDRDGAIDGSIVGKFNRAGTRMSGTLANYDLSAKAKLNVRAVGATADQLREDPEQADEAGITAGDGPEAVRVARGGGSTAGAVGSSTGGPTSSAGGVAAAVDGDMSGLFDAGGELHFLGTYDGTVTVGFSPEVHGRRPEPFINQRTLAATMTITSETEADLLRGTLVIDELGSYDVVGVVKFNDMTLIVTPAGGGAGGPGAGGVGAAQLKISADGLNYAGRYRQEAASEWAFGRMDLTRTSAVPVGPDDNGTTNGAGGTGTGDGSGTGNGSGTGTGTGTDTTGGVGSSVSDAGDQGLPAPTIVNDPRFTGTVTTRSSLPVYNDPSDFNRIRTYRIIREIEVPVDDGTGSSDTPTGTTAPDGTPVGTINEDPGTNTTGIPSIAG